jgi:putative hemolysin
MEILLILGLTLLNALFAMSELAMSTARKVRLAAMADAGDKGAAAAIKLADEPTRMLSTVQVGITSIGLLNGIVGEAAFAAGVATQLQVWGMPEALARPTATFSVVVVLAYITLIFGEMVPKRIGLLYPELVARWVARPMNFLATATAPFIKLISWSTETVLRLLRINTNQARLVTEEEISASLDEGMDAGVIEKHERRMVENVFHLDDRPLTSIMLPRADIHWFAATETVAGAMRSIQNHMQQADRAHSWYPVCRDDLDHVLGIVSLAQLLLHPEPDTQLENLIMPSVFVPETLTGMELLEQFRLRAGRMVFVVDEYGVLQGLLTPRDMLEAITGELKPELQAQAWALQQADGSWLLDALMPLAELKIRLEIEDDFPDEDTGVYNTLGGLLMAQKGRLLRVGDSLQRAGWRFEVLSLEGRRAEQVRAHRIV